MSFSPVGASWEKCSTLTFVSLGFNCNDLSILESQGGIEDMLILEETQEEGEEI